MAYKSLQDVIDSQSTLKEGFDYLVNNPLEFIALVKRDHPLALKFAQAFTTAQIETMLDKCYGIFNHQKFFTLLLTINPSDIAFHKAVSNKSMLQSFLTHKHLECEDRSKDPFNPQIMRSESGHPHPFAFYYNDTEKKDPLFWAPQQENPTAKSHLYGSGLEKKYRQETKDKDIIKCLFTIALTLLTKLERPQVLDGEFKEELLSLTESRTNSVFPTLMRWPTAEMGGIVGAMLRLVSPEIARKQLAANSTGVGSYLKVIITHYPKTKAAYEAAYTCFLYQAKQGRTAFNKYLTKFNFDILDALEKVQPQESSETNLALQFYELGNLVTNDAKGEENPIAIKYPATADKYGDGKETKFDPFSASSTSASFFPATATTSTTTTVPGGSPLSSSCPPAYVPPPAYNPGDSDNRLRTLEAQYAAQQVTIRDLKKQMDDLKRIMMTSTGQDDLVCGKLDM